ncbi:MAG TPA: hypothetical protein VJT33_10220 [bacterium]|nr:hypothetical protein [bacterium]
MFADAIGGAIRIMTAEGTIKTLYSGAPLTEPKDVAVDSGGGYAVADFNTFKPNSQMRTGASTSRNPNIPARF